MAALVGTSLGDIILAAALKDPEGVGRLVAQAITQAEPPDAGATLPEPKAEPKPEYPQRRRSTPPNERASAMIGRLRCPEE